VVVDLVVGVLGVVGVGVEVVGGWVGVAEVVVRGELLDAGMARDDAGVTVGETDDVVLTDGESVAAAAVCVD
jgi:hypothetical protein